VCEAAGIPIAGGHSIDSIEPIYGLVALGLAHPDRIRRNSDARVGDVLILGKPLGVGIYSAALKKGILSDEGYTAMISSATLLNRAGTALAELDDVHAMTDVTGFGLAGHALELARAAGVNIELNAQNLPVLPGVNELINQGIATGASSRNWQAYGHQVKGLTHTNEALKTLITDPQTSGGLLVSCSPSVVNQVLAIFAQFGCEQASVVGVVTGAPQGNLSQSALLCLR
jgi:selenide,water dikinase